jgi:hypothetical protein
MQRALAEHRNESSTPTTPMTIIAAALAAVMALTDRIGKALYLLTLAAQHRLPMASTYAPPGED